MKKYREKQVLFYFELKYFETQKDCEIYFYYYSFSLYFNITESNWDVSNVHHKLRQLRDLNKENEDFILLNIAQHSNKSSELRTPKCLPIMTSIETQNKSQKDSPNFLFILFSYRRNSFRLTTEVFRPIAESNSGYPLISFTVLLRVMRDLSKQFIFENGKSV